MVAQPLLDRHAAAFLALPDDGNKHEFVRGEVRSMIPPKGSHGRFEARVLKALDRYLDDRAVALGGDAESDPELRDRLWASPPVASSGCSSAFPTTSSRYGVPTAHLCPPSSSRAPVGTGSSISPRCRTW